MRVIVSQNIYKLLKIRIVLNNFLQKCVIFSAKNLFSRPKCKVLYLFISFVKKVNNCFIIANIIEHILLFKNICSNSDDKRKTAIEKTTNSTFLQKIVYKNSNF